MKSIAWMVLALLGLAACGDSDGVGAGRGGGTLCEDVCAWPRSCFDRFELDFGGADCVDSCETSVDFVGVACLEAIDTAVFCFGSCSDEDISLADFERCDEDLQRVGSACD